MVYLGASSGIGAQLAIDLTRQGAQVVISARRENLLNEIASQCEMVGKKAFVLPLDVTDVSLHKKSYDMIVEKFGKLDSLVLNAGS